MYSHYVPELDDEAAEKLNGVLDIETNEEITADTTTADVLDAVLKLEDDESVPEGGGNSDSSNN